MKFWNGLWLNAWCGYFEGAAALGVKFDEDKCKLLQRVNQHCPVMMWSLNGSVLFVLRRSKTVHWQDGFLHCENGAAVEYSDTFKLWSIRGVAVDEQIVMQPETQTIKQINSEENEERKRIRIDRFGWLRYLDAVNATVIDERVNDIEQTREALMQCDDMRVLVCACPSTAKVFSLEVDPEMETCEQAQTWLHSGSAIDELTGQTRVIGRT